MIGIQFLLDVAKIVINGEDCCCAGCPICTHCDDGCVTDPSQAGDVCGSITDSFGTRDLNCCFGTCTDHEYDDSYCGGCPGSDCAAGGNFCCAGVCVGSPC